MTMETIPITITIQNNDEKTSGNQKKSITATLNVISDQIINGSFKKRLWGKEKDKEMH